MSLSARFSKMHDAPVGKNNRRSASLAIQKNNRGSGMNQKRGIKNQNSGKNQFAKKVGKVGVISKGGKNAKKPSKPKGMFLFLLLNILYMYCMLYWLVQY